MTTESAMLVRVPVDALGLRSLLGDIRAAKARADKAIPGERTDVIRYEALSSQLERVARIQMGAGSATSFDIAVMDRVGEGFFDSENVGELPTDRVDVRAWIAAGDAAVELRTPLLLGRPPVPQVSTKPLSGPAMAWRAVGDDGHELKGSRAVEARFSEQLQHAVDGDDDASLAPSGVSNSVLTNGLRAFVNGEGSTRRDVAVTYRDGSTGPDFPLCCLNFGKDITAGLRTFRFSMLSIRHTEMDVEVDGAWLRNTDISRPRPAGDTDRLVYELSQKQLETVCADGPVLLYLYQTGLDTAIVGFYRAVTERLLADQAAKRPGSVAVVPMYFRRSSPGRESVRRVAGYEQQSTFAEGTHWTL